MITNQQIAAIVSALARRENGTHWDESTAEKVYNWLIKKDKDNIK